MALPVSRAAVLSRTLGFASLYAFVDVVLDRAGAPLPAHHIGACAVAGLAFGLLTRRVSAGLVAGSAVGVVSAPAVWALHAWAGVPSPYDCLRAISAPPPAAGVHRAEADSHPHDAVRAAAPTPGSPTPGESSAIQQTA